MKARFRMFAVAPRCMPACMLACFALATSAAGIHCSSTRDGFEPPPKEEEPPVIGSFVDASTSDADAESPPLSDCADENKLIYVLSQGEKALYRFDPEALTFTNIGRLKCPTSTDTFSMAVDRRGNAWVEYTDGRIYKVSTKDASCVPTAYRPGQHELRNFGMGFAKDDNEAGAPLSETLYLAGSALAKLDLSTLEVSIVGSSSTGLAELTGTGAGTLYAFLDTGDRVVQLDKTNGAILKTYRPDVTIGNGWAFAQWGGDFWLFTAPRGRSSVTRYSPKTNTSTVVVEDTGMVIIGAGSSTCAPSEPR